MIYPIKSNSRKIAYLFGGALIALASTSAQAGSAAPDVSANNAQLTSSRLTTIDTSDEIIVTARRRGETIGTVPISISAYTAADMQSKNISSFADLGNSTPGLSITSIAGGTAQNIYIRGLAPANTANDLNVEANVGVFIDGMYQSSRNTLDMLSVLDVGQIDVLKGPQSSLLGRSTFAGAISISTGRPTEEFEGNIQATVGTESDYRVRGSLSGPLGAGFSARVAAGYMTYDGWGRNQADRTDNLGGTEKWAVLGAIEYDNGSPFTARLAGFITDSKTEVTPLALLPLSSFNAGNVNAQVGLPHIFKGTLEFPHRADISTGIPDTTAKNRQVTLEMKWDMGPAAFTSTTGYLASEGRAFNDFDGTSSGALLGICSTGDACFPAGAYSGLTRSNLVSTVIERVRAFSQELRVQSNNESAFSWMFGANYFDQRVPVAANGIGASRAGLGVNDRFVQVAPTGITPTAGFGGYEYVANPYIVDDANTDQVFANWSKARTETISGFAALGYDFGNLRINAEGRYNIDRKSAEVFSVLNMTNAPGIYPSIPGTGAPPSDHFPVTGEPFKATFKSFTPRFTIDYRPVENVFLYASAAKGVRSGGFNTANAVGPTGLLASEVAYDEEENWTYEVGFKSHLLDRRWEFTASAFKVDWNNAQVSSFTENQAAVNPIRIVRNVGKINAKGFELSTQFRPVDPLTFGGSMIHSSSRFGEGAYDGSNSSQCVVGAGETATAAPGCPPVIVVTTQSGAVRAVPSLEGNRTQRSVKLQWNAFATLTGKVNDDWTAIARVDVNHSGPAYADLMNMVSFGKRTLTNFNFNLGSDKYSVSIWGKNVFDVKYVSNAILQPRVGLPVFPAFSVPEMYLGEGSRYGVTVNVKF